MDFISNLYSKNKVLFYILLPLVILIYVVNALGGIQKVLALATVKVAEKKDSKIKKKISENEAEVRATETRIATKEDRMATRKVEDVPLDWNETFKQDK